MHNVQYRFVDGEGNEVHVPTNTPTPTVSVRSVTILDDGAPGTQPTLVIDLQVAVFDDEAETNG